MMQRLNAKHKTIDILLEGDTTAIATNSTLDSALPWHESTVWGDMFSSTVSLRSDAPPFTLYACSDSNLIPYCSPPPEVGRYPSRARLSGTSVRALSPQFWRKPS